MARFKRMKIYNAVMKSVGKQAGSRGPVAWLLRLPKFIHFLVLIVLIWGAGSLALWQVERNNPEFGSFGEAAWNIAVYSFSGLDTAVPQTPIGRLIATACLLLSVAAIMALTASLTSFMVVLKSRRKKKMPGSASDRHIIICNWNDKALEIIRQLHASIVKHKRPIVVISEDSDSFEQPEEDAFEDVTLIKGDPAKEVILRRAKAQYAHSVVVLADPAQGHLADAKSILIVMALRRTIETALQESGEEDLEPANIVVEGLSAANVDHLLLAGAGDVISASDFATLTLAQAARFPKLGSVYRDLLLTSAETDEIYFVEIPSRFTGKPYAELGKAILEASAAHGVTLLGLNTGGRPVINPKPGQIASIGEKDCAIVLATTRPDLEEILG